MARFCPPPLNKLVGREGAGQCYPRFDSLEHLLEIGHRPGQAGIELDRWLPTEDILRHCDVRAPLERIVFRQWAMDDARGRTGHADHPFRQFAHGDFVRIADIDRTGDVGPVAIRRMKPSTRSSTKQNARVWLPSP